MKQLPKSVVREIRTLRSVGAGGGQLPPATRWLCAIMIPTPTQDVDRLLLQISVLPHIGFHRPTIPLARNGSGCVQARIGFYGKPDFEVKMIPHPNSGGTRPDSAVKVGVGTFRLTDPIRQLPHQARVGLDPELTGVIGCWSALADDFELSCGWR